MSEAAAPTDARREENLETLADHADALQKIAASDLPYAEDAERFLTTLREAGYDV